MRAKIKFGGWKAAPEGHTVNFYAGGTIVEGKLAEMAIRSGGGTPLQDPRDETKVDAPQETKAKRKRGRPRKVESE